MASFSDYLKEMSKAKTETEKAKDDLSKQIGILMDNINLRIEELRCAKDFIQLYDYLYIMLNLKRSHELLSEAKDVIEGWYVCTEEGIEDLVFEEGEQHDKD